MKTIEAVFETSSNTSRLKTRNDQFTGEAGKFNTTYNTVVRLYGEVAAKAIKLNKDFYKNRHSKKKYMLDFVNSNFYKNV